MEEKDTITNSAYQTLNDVSRETATRDLNNYLKSR